MKKILLWFFVLGFLSANAQDTLTVMQYNLLNYGNYTSYCPSNINNVAQKTGYIGTIVHYVKPDIFTVNEISTTISYHDGLLNNGLNSNGVDEYAKASDTFNNGYQYTMNVLFYNKNKLGEAGHTIAQTYTRDVDVYKLYYKSSRLSSGDTTFLYCVVAHLKAGNDYNGSTTNQNKRKIMAENTMDYIATHQPDNNYLLSGDFNLYSDQEPAFQQFVDYKVPAIRFNDPANEIGDWHNNPDFSLYQTQSTHTIDNGCASSGGLDDRFDFILISNNIKNDNKRVGYLAGSFHVVGQDGKHFNQSLISSPANTSVPSDVLNALYNNSDHLPVTLKLVVNEPVGIQQFVRSAFDDIQFRNPVADRLNLRFNVNKPTTATIEIYSLLRQQILMKKERLQKGRNQLDMNVSSLLKGMYIVRFTDGDGLSQSRKMLKR